MDYNKLSLVELKNHCKKRNLPYGGTKSQLIKRIKDFDKPQPITVNDHKGISLPKGKKIIGVKFSDSDRFTKMSKEVEIGRAKLMYYSMDVFYYITKNDFS